MTRELKPEEFAEIKKQVIEKLTQEQPDLAEKGPDAFRQAYQPLLMEAARLATLTPEKAQGGVIERAFRGLRAWNPLPLVGAVAEAGREQFRELTAAPGRLIQAVQQGQPVEAALQMAEQTPGLRTMGSLVRAGINAYQGRQDPEALMRAAALPARNVPVIGPLAQGAVYGQLEQARQAGEELEAGNINRAIGYGAAAAIPLAGPALTAAGERIRGGDVAGGLVEGLATVFSPKLPKGIPVPGFIKNRNLELRGLTERAMARNWPVDVATASGTPWVESMQRLGGEGVVAAVPTHIRLSSQARKYEGIAGGLAEETGVKTPVSKAEAGAAALEEVQAARDLQRTKGREQYSDADMYVALADPEFVPTAETITSGRQARAEHSLGRKITVDEVQELRRIMLEMEERPFEPHHWREAETRAESNVPSGHQVLTPGHAGAAVYDDIVANMEVKSRPDPTTGKVSYAAPEPPTRGEVIASLKRAIATGHFTGPAKGAMTVVQKRMQPGSAAAKKAELPPGAGALPPKELQLPVDVRDEKATLRPAYERQLEFIKNTNTQADRGFQALARFMQGPDDVPIQELDKFLSEIKGISRAGQEVADVNQLTKPSQVWARQVISAVEPKLKAKAETVPGLLESLEKGREHWRQMYDIEQTREALAATESAVSRFNKVSGPAGAEILADVKRTAPAVVPRIARAKLDQLNELAFNGGPTGPQKAWNVWNQLDQRSLDIMFPDKAHQGTLRDLYQIMAARAKNVNPSGSGLIAAKAGEAAALTGSAVVAALQGNPAAVGAPIYSTIMGAIGLLGHSPKVARMLVQGTRIPVRNPAALAAWGRQLGLAVKEVQANIPAEEEPAAATR